MNLLLSPIPISPVVLALLLVIIVGLAFLARAQWINMLVWKGAAKASAERAYKQGRDAEAKLHKAPLDVRINDAYQRGIRDCNLVWTERLEKGRRQIDPRQKTESTDDTVMEGGGA
jgi:hypothetical protein